MISLVQALKRNGTLFLEMSRNNQFRNNLILLKLLSSRQAKEQKTSRDPYTVFLILLAM